MYGVVNIATPVRNAVAVPRESVLRVGDETVVFVERQRSEDGRASFQERRVVTDEHVAGDLVPVLAGLTSGERVATRGAIFFLGM